MLVALPALGASRVDVLKVDLESLIRASADVPTQFAVSVPAVVNTDVKGQWTTANGVSSWRYAVRIPTSVSLSFHAERLSLPAGATLTVRGGASSVVYRAQDVHGGGLWSRIAVGDTLEFSVQTPASARRNVALSIRSFQAGYRSLGGRVKDHPYYRRLKALAAAVGSSACVQNYECSVTAGNTPPAQATVGLIINNLYQCSGTLLNDVSVDNTPYVLTARHCQTGQLGGGDPGAARGVSVYWNAVTACDQALGTLYDPGLRSQTGATTVVEQQDIWLIRLDASPVVADAQLAGFDASGGAVQGGYTIHHALGFNKQLTRWYGRAAVVRRSNVLGTTYTSNFLDVVNQVGNIGPGASGSALINQNSRVVGALTLGRKSTDASGYGSCPSNPVAPNGSNGVADFTSLSAVWNSTADRTSTTGNVTLKSVLDPANTGARIVASAPAASIQFTANTYSLQIGQAIELTWNTAPVATQCTATGGVPGDGWSGVLGGAASLQITESVPGVVNYSLSCQLNGNRRVSAVVSVTWGSPAPELSITAPTAVWTTRPAQLSWTSNVAPCAVFGGSLNLADLPSSGSATTTQDTPGDVSYAIQCGPSPDTIGNVVTISYVTPSMVFSANGSDRLLSEPLLLTWQSYADSCAPSGGAPNDGWSTTAFPDPSGFPTFSPSVTTLGTFIYTLTCSSGPISLTKDIAVTIDNGAPFVTAAVDRDSYVFANNTADGFTLSWNSNLSSWVPQSDPPIAGFSGGTQPQDSDVVRPQPGTYQFSVVCNKFNSIESAASAPITVTVLPPDPPTASISVTPGSITVGQSVVVSWFSTNTLNCSGAGGLPDQAWSPIFPTGTLTFVADRAGTFTFGLSCPSIFSAQANAQAQADLTVNPEPPITIDLSASAARLITGQSLTLTWSSTNATGCVADGGAPQSAWSGNVATSGTFTENLNATGNFSYTLSCTSITQSADAHVVVSVAAAVAGGNGGGGTLTPATLAGLAALATLLQRVRRRRFLLTLSMSCRSSTCR